VPKEVPEETFPDDADVSTRAPRKKPTIMDHIGHYDQLFNLLDTEIDRKSREKEKGTRSLRTIRKTLIQMRKEVPQITRSKEARKQSSTRKETTSGLMMKFVISNELADFLKVPRSTRLSRVEVTRAICIYAHLKDNEKRDEMLRWKYLNPGGTRNLQFPQDKKAIIPDKALSKLLRYDEYKKKVASGLVTHKSKNKETGKVDIVKVKTDALYYWAIQDLLNVHFLKESDMEDEADEEDEEEVDDE
jgi:chromatin remodeling complex protein RSC6